MAPISSRLNSCSRRSSTTSRCSSGNSSIAHNRLNDYWRGLKHRPATPEDGDERAARVPDPTTPERELSEFEQRRRLQLAIAALPEEQREVVLLRLEQELSLEDIGEITGVGRETVKSRLRYAMDKLRAGLSDDAGELSD